MKRRSDRKFRCTYLYRKFKRCTNPLNFHIDEEGAILCTVHQNQLHDRCEFKKP